MAILDTRDRKGWWDYMGEGGEKGSKGLESENQGGFGRTILCVAGPQGLWREGGEG